jgi:hypothetical protein
VGAHLAYEQRESPAISYIRERSAINLPNSRIIPSERRTDTEVSYAISVSSGKFADDTEADVGVLHCRDVPAAQGDTHSPVIEEPAPAAVIVGEVKTGFCGPASVYAVGE